MKNLKMMSKKSKMIIAGALAAIVVVGVGATVMYKRAEEKKAIALEKARQESNEKSKKEEEERLAKEEEERIEREKVEEERMAEEKRIAEEEAAKAKAEEEAKQQANNKPSTGNTSNNKPSTGGSNKPSTGGSSNNKPSTGGGGGTTEPSKPTPPPTRPSGRLTDLENSVFSTIALNSTNRHGTDYEKLKRQYYTMHTNQYNEAVSATNSFFNGGISESALISKINEPYKVVNESTGSYFEISLRSSVVVKTYTGVPDSTTVSKNLLASGINKYFMKIKCYYDAGSDKTTVTLVSA